MPPVPLSQAQAILERVAAPAGSVLPLPHLLLVLAHPDDEVLALGARLERLADTHLVTATDGAPTDGADAHHHGFTSLEAYRAARQRELACALAHAGLSERIASPLAGVAGVPVPDQTAALHLADLTLAVRSALRAFAPEAVLTHPYEGGHPDHDACAFAVHMALRLEAQAAGQANVPLLVEAPFYHAGEGGQMRTGAFLEAWPSPATLVCPLSATEQANKRARLACFTSQAETLAQFGVAEELFRIAPRYDFTRPPHLGQLFYEQFPWGMQGERFRSLAADAALQLHGRTTLLSGYDPAAEPATLA